jgi:hypothetical protein
MRNKQITISGKFLERQGKEDFVSLLLKWNEQGLSVIFGFVWQGLDILKENLSNIDFISNETQLERDLTENLVKIIVELLPKQNNEMPFWIEHGSNEMNSVYDKKAKPPEYDFVFYARQKTTIKFPFEAKVLKYKKTVNLTDYIDTINSRFITGIYAPYSSHAAMVGYLLYERDVQKVLKLISEKLEKELHKFSNFQDRHHQFTKHTRINSITQDFHCHHLIYSLR